MLKLTLPTGKLCLKMFICLVTGPVMTFPKSLNLYSVKSILAFNFELSTSPQVCHLTLTTANLTS